jgi:hypothetical protein
MNALGIRKMSELRYCDHLWEAPLGTNWKPGRYIIEVRVKDMFNRIFTDSHTFRVVEEKAE